MAQTTTTASIASNGTAVPSSTPSNSSATMGESDFLTLLVAQLRYQDPMSPTDNQQFMQEQAQFSTVEGINKLEATMAAMQSSQTLAQSVSLIGKQVAYVGSDGTTLQTGVVSSVTSGDGTVSLQVGSDQVDPSSIVNVSDPGTGGGAGA